MRIGFIATRLSGIDGVSLEVHKWADVLQRMGHEVFYCAGELGGYAAEGTLIPQLHFTNAEVAELSRRAFTRGENAWQVADDIYAMADQMRPPLRRFIRENRLDIIIPQNALTIPMNIPLGVALTGLIAELGIPTVSHHHDFYWERTRYQVSNIFQILDTDFPPDLPNVRHVTINSIAQMRLKERRGIDSVVIPNVLDFATSPPGRDEYNQDFRTAIGLSPEDRLILQPTRVVPRKGIELAIELLHRLQNPNARLVITHPAGDEGFEYLEWLKLEAARLKVDMRLVADRVGPERRQVDGQKIYALWDTYPWAELVTYPSQYEGFGNALLEAVYFKLPIVVNRYPVYEADIRPLGFRFVEISGFISDEAVEQARELLNDQDLRNEIAEHNYALASRHFSYEVLKAHLKELIESF
ncbi:MAG TPA: glycosyltransferase [Anaerolineae bacterium]|nr:glycosyltransferase [Anaerolineae bacterium]